MEDTWINPMSLVLFWGKPVTLSGPQSCKYIPEAATQTESMCFQQLPTVCRHYIKPLLLSFCLTLILQPLINSAAALSRQHHSLVCRRVSFFFFFFLLPCVWLVLLFSPVGRVLHSLSISWASHIRRTSGVRHQEWCLLGTQLSVSLHLPLLPSPPLFVFILQSLSPPANPSLSFDADPFLFSSSHPPPFFFSLRCISNS